MLTLELTYLASLLTRHRYLQADRYIPTERWEQLHGAVAIFERLVFGGVVTSTVVWL
jgi:hypothetical protein